MPLLRAFLTGCRSRERSARASPAERRFGWGCVVPAASRSAGRRRRRLLVVRTGRQATKAVSHGPQRLSAKCQAVQGDARSFRVRLWLRLLDLDLDVDAGGQLEALERVDGLRTRFEDVEQPL